MKLSNSTIQGLYDAASGMPDENGISKFDEQKLRKYLNGSKIGIRNRDIFEQHESKYKTCPRYNPCPICDKCMSKASHLYKECEECNIPICSHTYDDREKMIKRKNFVEYVDKETMDAIKELDKEVCNAQ